MKTSCSILLCLLVCFELSCQMPPPSAQPPATSELTRLKITDLLPTETSPVQVHCAFAVLLYCLSPEQMQNVPKALSMLTGRTITFADPAAFESNGLWASAGTYDQTAAVLETLNALGARRLGTKKFLFFQDYPEEINGFPVEAGQTLFYLGSDRIPAAKQVPAGRLALMLRARPDTPQRGFASVRIEPLFQPAFSGFRRAAGSLFETLSFREGRLMTSMTEGDVLVLASPKMEEMSIFSRFFLAPPSKEPAHMLYLIVCQKAGE